MSDVHTLYEIKIQTPVSPSELDRFTDICDESGYTVITDLEHGIIELRGEAEGFIDE